jgi:flagellar motility protein MotE (MotC chaperone)
MTHDQISPAPWRCAALGSLMMAGIALVSQAQAQALAPQQATISEDIQNFCTNIADAARDQRYLLQMQELDGLQTEIDDRIKVLEERRAEYEDWLGRRDAFLKRAEDGLVEIYKGMRPDAAAAQLELVGAEIAAAIIMKLAPRQASQILNEMDNKVAAQLTGLIASAADSTTSRNPS